MLSCREDAYQCQCLLACDRDYDPRVLYCGVSSGRGRREYNGQGMRRAASKSGIEGEYNRQKRAERRPPPPLACHAGGSAHPA